jgi:hypothetical protein
MSFILQLHLYDTTTGIGMISHGGVRKPPRSHARSTPKAKPLVKGHFTNIYPLNILMKT